MKRNYNFLLRTIALFVMSAMVFASCSDDDNVVTPTDDDPTTTTPEEGDDEPDATPDEDGVMLSSIAVVASSYVDGYPVAQATTIQYKFSDLLTSTESNSVKLRFRLNPTKADVSDMKWSLIKRNVETRADGDSSVIDEIAAEDFEIVNGEFILDCSSIEGITYYASSSDVADQYALVASSDEMGDIVSDFTFIEESTTPTIIDVSEVKLSDGENGDEPADSADAAKSMSIEVTGVPIEIPTLNTYAKVGEDWKSFDDIGFDGCSVVAEIDESASSEWSDFEIQLIEGKYYLCIKEGKAISDLNRTIVIKIYIKQDEKTIKTYYICYVTYVKDIVSQQGEMKGDLQGGYYVDGGFDTTSTEAGFDYSEENYDTSFDYGEGVVWGVESKPTVIWDGYSFYLRFAAYTFSTGGSYPVRVVFTNKLTGIRYIYVYTIVIYNVPTINLPTMTTFESYGSGKAMTVGLSKIITKPSVTTDSELVTFKVSLTGDNATKATLYNGGQAVSENKITGTYKEFSLTDYSVQLNNNLSGDNMDVQVQVKVLRNGVDALTSDTGTVTFKNPIVLTKALSYEIGSKQGDTCDLSKDVTVTLYSDSDTEGTVVYSDGTYKQESLINVEYATASTGLSITGSTMKVDSEDSPNNASFDIKVTAPNATTPYASKSETYISVAIN